MPLAWKKKSCHEHVPQSSSDFVKVKGEQKLNYTVTRGHGAEDDQKRQEMKRGKKKKYEEKKGKKENL